MPGEQGIDVAWPQGARYNWDAWRGKIQFGMCKATEGAGFRDQDFGANWDSMWALSRQMPRFAYHYFRPADDPYCQAEFFTDAVKAHGLFPGDNFVADFETTDSLPTATVARQGVQFLRHVNALAPGHRVLAYTYPAFARAGNCAGMESWFLWVAGYGVPRPAVPAPWDRWTFWQRGTSPVDTDVFNGTAAELLAFTRMPASR